MEALFLTTFAVAICCLVGWWRADLRLRRERLLRESGSIVRAAQAVALASNRRGLP